MATKKIRSIKGRTMRLTRLDECGAPDTTSECGSIVSDGFISVTIANEVEKGQEYTQKNAWGDFCISEKDADRVKWANVTISMCEVDPEVLDIIGGATPVVNGSDTIGATFGTQPNPNSFAIEVWTKKAGGDVCAVGGDDPEWGYFVVPYVRNGILTGDVKIENAPMTIGLVGEGIGAIDAWGEGPYGDNPMLVTGGFPVSDLYGMVVTTVQPPAPTDGCVQVISPTTLATAGIPATLSPIGSTPPATVAALIAGTPVPVVASPLTAWTTGQYMQTQVAGAPGRAYWNGTTWVAGVAP